MTPLKDIKFTHPMNDEYRVKKLLDLYHKYGTLYIGVDFDNTLKPYSKDKEGDYSQILELLQECKKLGFILCLWSVPNNEENLQMKVQWCKENNIEMSYINDSPLCKEYGARKCHFNILLDDASGLESAYKQLYSVVEQIKEENGKE